MEGLFPPPTTVASELSGGDDGLTNNIEETSNLESQGGESIDTEWTDEKHSLYLKSMETSFVNQLYKSLNLHGSCSRKDFSSDAKSSRQMHASTHTPSGQFKVLRDGCWARVNFRRGESVLHNADDSSDLSANPWIRHFRSAGRHRIVSPPALQEKTALATTNKLSVFDSHLCRQDSVGSDTEVTDQNFVDEDFGREMDSRMCSTKKIKISEVASSSNDQVVPFRVFSVTEDVEPSSKE